ncbi:hypothetical protein AB833_04545 [Chromatiales bacterium (ex Bugula neritina AB1)]|nr:hypothetical protein AB833_04545 [Chromatiales bacterium (ex Bugula neritina AB1)]
MSDFILKRTIFAALAASLIVGCESGDSQVTDTLTVDSTGLSVPLPQRIRSITALDPDDISALAMVNGVQVPLSRSGDGSYRGQTQVAARSTFPVTIEFSETFSGNKLVLASNSQQLSTSDSNASVRLRRYEYDYDSHDSDNDSVSNIIEREEDTDPFDGTDSPEMVGVSVLAQRPSALGSSGFSDFIVEATVGNSIRRLTASASGNGFTGEFRVPRRTPLPVTVSLVELVTGNDFRVSNQSQQLSVLTDQQSVVFTADAYSAEDRDGDGQSDLAELIAGTNISDAGNSPVNTVSYTVMFSVPADIQNPQNVYAELRAGSRSIGLSRNTNNYSATDSATAGDNVTLKSDILDTFNGQPYVLATAQTTVQISGNGQSVVFTESDFQLDIDTDNDGVANYIERQQGTNPLAANVVVDPVSCSISAVPAVTATAGQRVSIDNISGFVDCGSAPFVLASSEFDFEWNQATDQIQWTVPANTAAGATLSFAIAVRNPADDNEEYATVAINTLVQATECTVTTEQFVFTPTRDVFRSNNNVVAAGPLRVELGQRQALIGFNISLPEGELVGAALTLTVASDGGNGTISVFHDNTLVWSESDDSIDLPVLSSAAGALTQTWVPNQSSVIPLTNLFLSSGEFTLLLLQTTGNNDISFNSINNSDGPELTLSYSGCFGS